MLKILERTSNKKNKKKPSSRVKKTSNDKHRKLKKYEKDMLYSLNVIKFCALVIGIMNLAFPIYSDGTIGLFSPFQWLIVIILIEGVLNAVGLFNQHVPFVEFFIVRFIQMGVHIFVSDIQINWIPYVVLLVLDWIYLFLLLKDKSHYEYIVE